MTDNITLPRTVVEQALEAFEDHAKQYPHMQKGYTIDAANALRAALEQPQVEQEPIAWANINKHGDITHTSNKKMSWAKTPRYTNPQPPRQPLTDDEINTIWRNSTHMTIVEVVRAIEAAHGIGGES